MAIEMRRSPRIVRSVPLLVSGPGRSARAMTAVINLHGALVICSERWPAGTIVSVTNDRTTQNGKARVIWEGVLNERGHYKFGIEFLEPKETFWGSDYNTADASPAPENGSRS